MKAIAHSFVTLNTVLKYLSKITRFSVNLKKLFHWHPTLFVLWLHCVYSLCLSLLRFVYPRTSVVSRVSLTKHHDGVTHPYIIPFVIKILYLLQPVKHTLNGFWITCVTKLMPLSQIHRLPWNALLSSVVNALPGSKTVHVGNCYIYLLWHPG